MGGGANLSVSHPKMLTPERGVGEWKEKKDVRPKLRQKASCACLLNNSNTQYVVLRQRSLIINLICFYITSKVYEFTFLKYIFAY